MLHAIFKQDDVNFGLNIDKWMVSNTIYIPTFTHHKCCMSELIELNILSSMHDLNY